MPTEDRQAVDLDDFYSAMYCRHWGSLDNCDETCGNCGHWCADHWSDDYCGDHACECDGWVD